MNFQTTTAEPHRFLLIEDDDDQRELIAETLQDQFGLGTVATAADGRAALQHDLSQFHLILSDFNLPDYTGIQLLAEIRRRCDTPVIMVTGENVGRFAVEAVNNGATDYVVKVGDYLTTIPLVVEKNLTLAKMKRENEQLRVELERTLVELQFKNGQLQESLQRVEQMAATDPLTSLYNRRHFGRVLEQLFSEAQRLSSELSCVMIDLDGYKQCNDTFGHQTGDQLLVAAGQCITGNLRKMDVAARYGGDEFVLLLPHALTVEAAGVADRIRNDYFRASAAILKRDTGIRMSVGIASLYNNPASRSEQLLAAADAALYRSKEAGRDRITVAEPTAPQLRPSTAA